jgi:Arc/MetJ-type ribon-helix-helix transcriptional regulator
MGEMLIRVEGAVEKVLNRLVEAGFFKTKTEAIRAGILELGREYSIVKSKEEILDELAVAKMQRMEEQLRTGKRKTLTEEQVKKKYGFR